MRAAPEMPTLKGPFFVGSLPEFNKDTLRFLCDIRDYGELVQFRYGPIPVLVANSPNVIHDILVTQASKFYKPALTKAVMAPAIGNGLFMSDGDFWRRQRRLMQPAFHTKRIGAYASFIADSAQSLIAAWRDGETRAIDHDMTELTLRVIAKTLFHTDVAHEAKAVGALMAAGFTVLEKRLRRFVTIPTWLPTPENLHMKRLIRRMDTLIQRIIDARRASSEDKGDFLSLLLMAQDEDHSMMTDKQVRDEAVTLFGAGHETTAVALTWTWYLLSQHPAVEAKLHEELYRVLGGQVPTLEDLPRLTYTEMVIKEAMRLYPPAWAALRQAHEPVTVSGYPIRKGRFIFINIYGLHHDPELFSHPEQFDPERFSPEKEPNIPKGAYLPFGTGPRVCIGNAFSLMESRLILATIAQYYRLTLAPGQTVIPERLFTLRPKYRMRMIARKREGVDPS